MKTRDLLMPKVPLQSQYELQIKCDNEKNKDNAGFELHRFRHQKRNGTRDIIGIDINFDHFRLVLFNFGFKEIFTGKKS